MVRVSCSARVVADRAARLAKGRFLDEEKRNMGNLAQIAKLMLLTQRMKILPLCPSTPLG